MPRRNGLPDPDRYYLPALKIEAEMGKVQFISNSSYYNRLEHTAYQGTSYDLAYFQSIGWPAAAYGGYDANGNGIGLPCGSASTTPVPALLLVSAAGRERRASAARDSPAIPRRTP